MTVVLAELHDAVTTMHAGLLSKLVAGLKGLAKRLSKAQHNYESDTHRHMLWSMDAQKGWWKIMVVHKVIRKGNSYM